ncbi:SIS domain-containing protein [Acidithiobacillus sp. AMEEHan]|uniref:D-sedoheptulose-7-phosphate isomerase n=1 Tax=Acidithiobacillus sp. AMEEHan TaxID=2994951 RepID=UPI0027E3CD0B|nr:SIS domain-containing protein [Acidithiobacillus sp. AMEEHan]
MRTFKGATQTYLAKLMQQIDTVDYADMDRAVALVARAWQDDRQVIALGNGGSSMTALHFINDWNKSVSMRGGRRFRGRTLVDNVGLLMSYANDIAFNDVFVEQLRHIMDPGDLVIAISGSGNSENVIRAVDWANANGGITLGLCGYNGGRLKDLVQHRVWVAVDDMQLCEDIHAIFGHIVMQTLCGDQELTN